MNNIHAKNDRKIRIECFFTIFFKTAVKINDNTS